MEAINIFLEKETKSNMFDRELFGIKYWQYIRAMVSCEANTFYSNSSPMFTKATFSIKKYLINIKKIHNYFLPKKEHDILIFSHPRRGICENGKYRNNYVDYYYDYLKNKYEVLMVEEPT